MKKLPFSRTADIIIQEVDKEILIYDLNTHKAYCLNETSSTVYRACDGNTSFDELKRKYKFTENIIFLALDELKKENLLEVNQQYKSPFTGMSRREVIRKIGYASVISFPVISSLVAPPAAAAQSGICGCVNPGQCLTKTSCSSQVNCNSSRQCAP